ncbi:hypothetical protein K0L52_004117 [Vibrio fluvialis]|nr:hypothetical protein [Vibrio fluvialis]
MKNKSIPLIIHSITLALCLAGGYGMEWAENLFSVVIVFVSVCMMISATQLTAKEFEATRSGKKTLFSFVRVAFALEVVLSFAFGWFVIGSLLSFGLLLVAARTIQLKEELQNANTNS